jgi:HK97 family phage portal protein
VAIFTRPRRSAEPGPGQPLIPYRWSTGQAGSVIVDTSTALRHSAVWAAVRMRADMVSTMGFYCWRNNPGDAGRSRVPVPIVLRSPSGSRMDMTEWLYSSQVSLDLRGNAYGVILARDGFGRPSQIELVDPDKVVVHQAKDGTVTYTIHGQKFTADQVWHEKQNTMPGQAVGLSVIAYAAWTISSGLSAERFGLDWFRNGAFPSGHLKNIARKLEATEALAIKERFVDSVAQRQPFVSGMDWDFKALTVNPNESQFLETIKASVSDVARFFSMPAEMIGGSSGSSLTYANVEQRSIDFLTFHLDPTLVRRETALSRLVADPIYVQFDRDNLLRTDMLNRYKAYHFGVTARVLTPDDARAAENRPPLTDYDWTQFAKIPGAAAALAEGSSTK